MLDIGDLATWVTAVVGGVIAVSAAFASVQLRNRERRQALADLHTSLTSGETADARNVIGTLLYSSTRIGRPSRLEAIEAYFRLIWAVQRARNVFRAHGFHWMSYEAPRNRRAQLVEDMLTWNLREILDNVTMFHERYSDRWGVEDADAWRDIGDYLETDSVRGPSRPTVAARSDGA